MAEESRAWANLHKRGTAKSTVTKIDTKLREPEADPNALANIDCAKKALPQLNKAGANFKAIHFQILDLIPEDDVSALQVEQEALDLHEEKVCSLSLRIKNVITHTPTLVMPTTSPVAATDPLKTMSRHVVRLEQSLGEE